MKKTVPALKMDPTINMSLKSHFSNYGNNVTKPVTKPVLKRFKTQEITPSRIVG